MSNLSIAARYSIVLSMVLGGGAPALAQSVGAYDDTWYRATFWTGEYPAGFSVLKDTTIQLRPRLDPKAERTVACDLPAKATYQPWNIARAEEQGLAFVSFTKMAEYRLTQDYEATLYRSDDATEQQVTFKAGDAWRYLTYYAEGAFLMEYEGVRYDGDQSLLDVSEQVSSAEGYEEWLRINCPNNQWGWLYMGDIAVDDVTFAAPNITGYGEAKDLD
ncbi:MAG: hypothetical protein JNL14_05320 [Devosia sp.]|uniref:hypothetical protein n=1 Tax=Devosia sp. TaxID=1871048 RepID=UPI001A4E6641|nr:hypothetical protein [Devosia sp.]MBL8597138.1 hypothetical protein [Devosia sp.]